MRLFRLFVLATLAFFGPSPSSAADCNFRVGFHGLEDLEILRTFRCLNAENQRLRRSLRRLEQRVEELERREQEAPADFINADGEVFAEPGRAIGKGRFVLTASPTGTATLLPVDQTVVEELCGRPGGCSLSVKFTRQVFLNSESKVGALAGPCQFTYDKQSGDWAIGGACNGNATSGTDGDRRVFSDDTPGAIIAKAGGACLFSESELARTGGGNVLAPDRSRGVFLLSVPSLQPDGIRRFECELVLN